MSFVLDLKRNLGILLIFSALILLGSPLVAAIAYDNDAQTYLPSPGGSATTSSFTPGAGTNQILFVMIGYEVSETGYTVTYDGQPLALVEADSSTTDYNSIYYMVNPPAGPQNIVVTPNPATWNGPLVVTAFTYSGVNQTTPIGATAQTSGALGGAPWSLSLDITPTNLSSTIMEFSFLYTGGCTSSTFSVTDGTARYSAQAHENNDHEVGLGDWAPGSTGIVSFSHSYAEGSCSGGGSIVIQGVELLPAITITFTPTPSMPLVKTSNVTSVAFGNTVTYCLSWTNNSNSIQSFNVWDTVSPFITYLGCLSGCAEAGGVVSWTVSNAAAGANGSFCFWGTVSGYPMLKGTETQVATLPAKDDMQALFFPLEP